VGENDDVLVDHGDDPIEELRLRSRVARDHRDRDRSRWREPGEAGEEDRGGPALRCAT
jgi:hypothetical protein